MAKIRKRKPSARTSNVIPPPSARIAADDFSRAQAGYNQGVVTHGELHQAAQAAGRNVVDLTDVGNSELPSASSSGNVIPASRSRGERFGNFVSALRPGRAVESTGIQSLLNQGAWRNSGAEAPSGGRAPKSKPIDTGYFG